MKYPLSSDRLLSVAALMAFGGLYLLPLLAALIAGAAPAFAADAWIALWHDPQTLPALARTLCSGLLSTALALAFTLLLARCCFHLPYWQKLINRLPGMLALPHVAFTVGLAFLIAPGGWLLRLCALISGWPVNPPDWFTVNDPWGLSLALALALKETPFLLWCLAALAGEARYQQQSLAARCLGYRPARVWREVLQPQLLPRLAWPLIAVLAYSLTVIDMALIIGPDTPPTLAVLVWQWLADADPLYQAQAYAGALLLALLTAALLLLSYTLYQIRCRLARWPGGRRGHASRPVSARLLSAALPVLYLLVCLLLLLWSISGEWTFPAAWPQSFSDYAWRDATLIEASSNTLLLGAVSALVSLAVALLWLEWGWRRLPLPLLIYPPLSLPPLLLVAGQFRLLLPLAVDGVWWAVVWSHLCWTLPYLLLTLAPAYRAFDARYVTIARSLGHNRLSACLRVKWPLLAQPIAAALAIAFSVSVAQYLPTLYLGGGRLPTLTTEAVALSAGGDRPLLAASALLAAVLPAIVFALSRWLTQRRSALRA